MNLEEIGKYKEQIISKLVRDKNIVNVLLGSVSDDDDIETLLFGEDATGKNGCVFKFEYVPNTQEDTKTFLCVELVPTKTEGDTITNMFVYVFAYCSKAIMQTYRRSGTSGTRIDILMSDVDKDLNGMDLGIGKLTWRNGDIYKPAIPYYGRYSVYVLSAFRK